MLLYNTCIFFFFSNRYGENLIEAKSFGIKKGFSTGVGMGLMWFIIFGSYALAFWYGAKLVREDGYSAGQMLVVSDNL